MTTSPDILIEFLRSPESYPHNPRDVVEVQTHISWVFLAGEYVYKVKKPVSLGFLDFSTLEKRRHYCEEEVRLNRRLCPDIYEGVVAISERDGRFALEDGSHTTEVAVKMRRLQGGTFGHDRVAKGTLRRREIDRIVDTLATFYQRETTSPQIASWGRIEKLRISTDENFEQIEPFTGALLLNPAFEAIRTYTERFYDVHARMLNERRSAGRILDGHGDLHLEHVYLKEGNVCIYDCIEFSERLRWIDVANDVAFLAMDLDFHEQPNLARYFGRKMAQRLNDPELLRLLDFYKCYRAVVRGKVEGMRSAEDEVPEEERRKSVQRARRYFELALRYAVAGSRPAALVVMGRVGTGKSTVARYLADTLGWTVYSSDRLRKEQAGVEPFVRGSEQERASLYSAARSRETYEALTAHALDALDEGHGVILDATYSKRADREALRSALRDSSHAYAFIELTSSDEDVRHRLRLRDSEGDQVSDARLEDFEMLSGSYEAPDDLEDALHFRVGTDSHVDTTVEDALRHLIRLDLCR